MVGRMTQQGLGMKATAAAVLFAFAISSCGFAETAHAQTTLNLPAPGTMVHLSRVFKPLQIKGIEVSAQNPLHFEFLIDKGQSGLYGQPLKDEITRLSKYFLTCLTVPEHDLWVNLSPYEKERIAAHGFGVTQMGKDLLEQDYLLKQISATSTYPESALGKKFWQKVYKKAFEQYGTTDVPAGTFNKIWIVPKTARVYVKGNNAFVVESELDVMLETDYLALTRQAPGKADAGFSQAYTDVFREVLLPELRREINEGKNFAVVRQVYDAMILATWYKRHLKDGLLGRAYVGKNKVEGVDVDDKDVKEKIFAQYLQSFKKRVYNYIREDYDEVTGQNVPRKYVSGGMDFAMMGKVASGIYRETQKLPVLDGDLAMAAIDLSASTSSGKILRFPDTRTLTDDHPFRQVSKDLAMAGIKKAAATASMALMLALGGLAFDSSSADAAKFERAADGNVIVHIERGDRFGPIIQHMGRALERANPGSFRESVFSGPIWGPNGAVARLAEGRNVEALRVGAQIKLNVPFSNEALQLLPQAVAAAAAQAPVVPPPPVVVPTVIVPETVPQAAIPPPPAVSSPPPVEPPAAVLPETAAPAAGSTVITSADDVDGLLAAQIAASGRPRPWAAQSSAAAPSGTRSAEYSSSPGTEVRNAREPSDILIYGAGAGVLAIAFALGKFGMRTVRWNRFKRQEEEKRTAPLTVTEHSADSEASGPAAAAGEKPVRSESSVDPRAARPDEQRILAERLEAMRALAARGLAASLPKVPDPVGPSRLTRWAKAGGTAALNMMAWGGLAHLSAAVMSVHIPEVYELRHVLVGGAIGVMGLMSAAGLSVVQTLNTFGCGVIGLMMLSKEGGVRKKDIAAWFDWQRQATNFLQDRGGQQLGLVTRFTSKKGELNVLVKKAVKSKRSFGFMEGMVFYRNMIEDVYAGVYKDLPRIIRPIAREGHAAVLYFLGHVRYGTAGEIVEEAAHPHSSPVEKMKIWLFDGGGKLVSQMVDFVVTIAHNGDNDHNTFGLKGASLYKQPMGVSQMRRFLPAVMHKYQTRKITVKYLKKVVPEADAQGKTHINYAALLKRLIQKGYVKPDGRASRTFTGLDDEFKGWFPRLSEKFGLIESAIYGLPPGDSPLIPLAIRLFRTQGSWDSSVRYTHVMFNNLSAEEAMGDVLFEDDERALGAMFDDAFTQVREFVVRPFASTNPEEVPSLNNSWVDEKTAARLGLNSQREMLNIFIDLLAQNMKSEAQVPSKAGRVLKRWEEKWQLQGRDIDEARKQFAAKTVEKFFTADRLAATKEFASRSDGTYGIYVNDSIYDDGVTLYSNQQDIAVGLNHAGRVLTFASDPRVLKTDVNGKRMDEVVHMEDGEVLDLNFSPEGNIQKTSWFQKAGVWKPASQQALDDRFYPTMPVVNGQKNRYYAPPPMKYKGGMRFMVKEDLDNLSKIIYNAQNEWQEEGSFNRQSTLELAARLKAVHERTGSARLVVMGYANSFHMSKMLQASLGELLPNLKVDVIDTNDFIKSPLAYDIEPDAVGLVVSKSGATFASKLALQLLQRMVYRDNLFCMTARIDSVLGTILGQRLKPDSPFSGRMFVTGEFYPSLAPVASEVLLLYQMNQLAWHLAQDVYDVTRSSRNTFGMTFSRSQIVEMHKAFESEALRFTEAKTGIGRDGKAYAKAENDMIKLGQYLGSVSRRPFIIGRILDAVVAANLYAPWAQLLLGRAGVLLDWYLLRYGYNWLLSEGHSKMVGRPAHARTSPFQLFVMAPPMVAETQVDMIKRLFANGLSTTNPGGYYASRPEEFVTENGIVARGDIVLNITPGPLSNDDGSSMAGRQATYPKTGAFFGLNWFKGRGQFIRKPLEVFRASDDAHVMKLPAAAFQQNKKIDDIIASGEAMEGIDDNDAVHLANVTIDIPKAVEDVATKILTQAVGTYAEVLAYKVVGVYMAMRASLNGKLWAPGEDYSHAVVHTTPTPHGVGAEAKKIMAKTVMAATPGIEKKLGGVKPSTRRGSSGSAPDSAQTSAPGGIDMNSQLMDLTVEGEDSPDSLKFNTAFLSAPINGMSPQVTAIVPVTPAMLDRMIRGSN